VALSNLQPDLIRARNNYKIAIDVVKQVLNISLDTEIEIKSKLEQQIMEFNLPQLIETAMANRSDIISQEVTMKLREENLVVAKSGLKPDVSLFGNYSGRSETFGDSDPTDLRWGWNAGVRVSWDLFDGFGTPARTQQRRAEYNQSRIDLDKVKDGIELEVRQAYFKFNEALEVLGSQQKSVRQSQALADEDRITQFDLRDSQLELRTARTNLERALFEYNVALAKLQQAVGYDVEKLNTSGKNENLAGGQ